MSERTSRDLEYLDVEDLLFIVEEQGNVVGDLGLLHAAAERPRASAGGADAYPDLVTKAAALAESLCRNHALVDGNKRITLTAVRVFLRLNGYELALTDDEKFDLIMDIASGDLRSVEAIAARMPLRDRG